MNMTSKKTIIGLCGFRSAGKDTIANHLVRQYGFDKIGFADKLKEATAIIFGWDKEMLQGDTEKSRVWREARDEFWSREFGFNVTPRFVLQKLGTEVRDQIHQNVWCASVKKHLTESSTQSFAIADVRFPFEVEMIRELGGKIWRVVREKDPAWVYGYVNNDIPPANIHPSEYLWLKTNFDEVIYNKTTIDYLHKLTDTTYHGKQV